MHVIGLKFHAGKVWRTIARLDWSALAMIVALHMAVTYLGLAIFREQHLLSPVTFAYYYFTTATTIGYGDLSPTTSGGRAFAFVWIFPGALGFYMVLLAKVTQGVTAAWRKRMDGYGDFSKEQDRTVLLGYIRGATRRILRDLQAGGLDRDKIVLVATRKPDFNTERIDFIKTEDLVRKEDLLRAGVKGAKHILVMAEDDNATLAVTLAAHRINESAHIVASMECEIRAGLLTSCTNAVPVISQSPEVVASEVLDPGIGRVLSVLGSASTDATAFAVVPNAGEINAEHAHAAFRRLGMTFIGAQCPTDGLILNPPNKMVVTGLPLYYISARRIDDAAFREAVIDLQELQETNP